MILSHVFVCVAWREISLQVILQRSESTELIRKRPYAIAFYSFNLNCDPLCRERFLSLSAAAILPQYKIVGPKKRERSHYIEETGKKSRQRDTMGGKELDNNGKLYNSFFFFFFFHSPDSGCTWYNGGRGKKVIRVKIGAQEFLSSKYRLGASQAIVCGCNYCKSR